MEQMKWFFKSKDIGFENMYMYIIIFHYNKLCTWYISQAYYFLNWHQTDIQGEYISQILQNRKFSQIYSKQ